MPIPTHSRDDRVAWLRLTLAPGVLQPAQRALLREFGSPANALGASVHAAARVVAREIAEGLARGPAPALVARAIAWLEEPGHHLITINDAAYPDRLREIPDPPPVLYVAGRVELLNQPILAIVGSRNATLEGLQNAEEFARSLSGCGLTIASGMALGIDAAAHRGGLAAPGSSIAVLGTGADRIYPRRNAALAAELVRDGAVVSEFALATPPEKENFPRRNRVISGLSRGVLVVEAAPASGSLITAAAARDQNREVFAIPGSIHSPLARGCHALIKDGAKLVECANDVLEELHMEARATARAAAAAGLGDATGILEAMGFGPVTVDELARTTGRMSAVLVAQLSTLEIEGLIACTAGGRFQRVTDRVIE